jgi:hypothetical protein
MGEVCSRTAVTVTGLERDGVGLLLMTETDHLGMESAAHGRSTITKEKRI